MARRRTVTTTSTSVPIDQPDPAPAESGSGESYGDVSLTQGQHDRLANYLNEEIRRSEAETEEFRQNIILWRQFVDPRIRVKNFPWTNASNVFVPVPRMVLDALKASVKQTITQQRKLFTAEVTSVEHAGIRSDQETDLTEGASDFAEYICRDEGHLNLPRVIDEWSEELLITGIGPLKLTNEVDSEYLVVSPGTDPVEVVRKRGPRLDVVPTGTWVWPAGLWRSVQEMPWVGNWITLTAGALKARAAAPWSYTNVDAVLASGGEHIAQQDEDTEERESAIGQRPQMTVYRIHSIQLTYDLFDDGKQHALVVSYNLQSNKVLRVLYTDGWKFFDVEVASPRTGTIFGRGIIEPIVQPCRAINTAINQTFDAQTLANAPSILYPEESEAAKILHDSGFFPGLPIPYKESADEISVLKFPDASSVSYQMIEFFMSVVHRLTRIGPGRLGDVSEGRRTPATLGLATQQIGAELIDEMIDRLRDTLGRVVGRAFQLYYQSDPGIFVRVLGEERGTLLSGVISKSLTERRSLAEALRVRLFASSASRSAELEKQNTLAAIQMSMGYYRQVIELSQLYLQAPPGEAQAILIDVLKALEAQLKRLFDLMDQPDVVALVPEVSERLARLGLQQQAAAAAMGGGVVGAGAGGTAAGPLAPAPGAPPRSPSAEELSAMLAGLGGGGAQ